MSDRTLVVARIVAHLTASAVGASALACAATSSSAGDTGSSGALDDDGPAPATSDGGASDGAITGADPSGAATSDDGGPGSSSDAGGDDGPPVATCTDTPVAEAPPPQWINATGNLANMPSECGNLTMVSAKPCSTMVIAGVAKAGLFASDDGTTWSALGSGPGSAVITNRPASIVYDPDDPAVFWESGIYNGGGVYRTDDGGTTFVQLGDFGHDDVVSVDFTDPARMTLLAGSHEQKQRLMKSSDGGATWIDIGPNLPADSHFSSAPLVLDAQTFLLGACGWGDGTCGIFRSSDGGTTWSMASGLPAVGQPLWASDGTLYWSLIYASGIARSSDAGVTWEQPATGLGSGAPVELADGRLLTVAGDRVVVSSDAAATWTPVGETLPYAPAGVVFSAASKTLYVWRNDCGDVVLPDAILRAGFDA